MRIRGRITNFQTLLFEILFSATCKIEFNFRTFIIFYYWSIFKLNWYIMITILILKLYSTKFTLILSFWLNHNFIKEKESLLFADTWFTIFLKTSRFKPKTFPTVYQNPISVMSILYSDPFANISLNILDFKVSVCSSHC